MKKDEFYSDINLINLPIFSTSKKVELKHDNRRQVIAIEKNNVKTTLVITYPGQKLTFFDRKILAGIEYLFCKKFDFEKIKEEYDKEFPIKKAEYLKEKKQKEEYLTERDQQTIIINTMRIVKERFQLYLYLKNINDLVFHETYMHGDIKKSVQKLSSTRIHQKSDYLIEDETLEIDLFLIEALINREMIDNEREGKKDFLILTLNPLHIFNMINGHITQADLKLMSSFSSTIAGRLSELLKKSLYGSQYWKKNKVVFPYEYICDYLHIKKHTYESDITRQLKKPFKELIEKNIIVNWLLEKDLWGNYEISFYHSNQFYYDFCEMLDKVTKIKIEKKTAEITQNETEYFLLQKQINNFIENAKVKTEGEKEKLKTYYRKYLILTEYL